MFNICPFSKALYSGKRSVTGYLRIRYLVSKPWNGRQKHLERKRSHEKNYFEIFGTLMKEYFKLSLYRLCSVIFYKNDIRLSSQVVELLDFCRKFTILLIEKLCAQKFSSFSEMKELNILLELWFSKALYYFHRKLNLVAEFPGVLNSKHACT